MFMGKQEWLWKTAQVDLSLPLGSHFSWAFVYLSIWYYKYPLERVLEATQDIYKFPSKEF